MPFSVTFCGIKLWVVDEVSNDVTDTTTWCVGSVRRLAMVCNASTIWLATTVLSTVSCGLAAWPPLPVISISNWSAAAKNAPGRIAKLPTGRPGQLCMP